jgi:hypothetical protein
VNGNGSHGRISTGIAPNAAAVKTIDFIARSLPAWRDDPERSDSKPERVLNSQLCKFLNVMARKSNFNMVHFHHEEGQGTVHSADFSANPVDGGLIEGQQFTKYDPIVVFEGKRLPTPGTKREREYLTSPIDKSPGGGVQRFKLGLHGRELTIAGMVAYVQDRKCPHWFKEINRWIDELAQSGNPLWTRDDLLENSVYDGASRVLRCASTHRRNNGVTPSIQLTHLWVEM